MYLNTFALGGEPVDLTGTDEFVSLVASSADLRLEAVLPVRYQSRNLVLNGLRLHMLEWGEPTAPALLLLHGGHQSAHSWDLVSLLLAPRYHIIALDQRGHGDSEWPRDGVASRQTMADDARQLIERLTLRDPIVIGHSMGGLVTLTLLLAHPGLVRKTVLVDVGPEVAAAGREMIGTFVRSAREFASLEDYIARVVAYDPFRSEEHIRRTARYNLMQRADGMFVSKHDPQRQQVGEETPMAAGDSPTLAEVGQITCPVLLVRGEQSNILLPEAAERFVGALPNSHLVVVPRSGHNVHSQNTAGFLAAVVPFLED